MVYFGAGVFLTLISIILKKFYKYYELKILPTKLSEESAQYFKNEQDLAKKGAYNVPLGATDNNKQSFYNFSLLLGIMLTIFSFIFEM